MCVEGVKSAFCGLVIFVVDGSYGCVVVVLVVVMDTDNDVDVDVVVFVIAIVEVVVGWVVECYIRWGFEKKRCRRIVKQVKNMDRCIR